MGRVQGNTSRNCSISELRSTLAVTRLNDLLLHIYTTSFAWLKRFNL
ncbi:MAG: hypothetical protein ACTS7D_00515 [Candidatus Hodgkinia cicadicola]